MKYLLSVTLSLFVVAAFVSASGFNPAHRAAEYERRRQEAAKAASIAAAAVPTPVPPTAAPVAAPAANPGGLSPPGARIAQPGSNQPDPYGFFDPLLDNYYFDGDNTDPNPPNNFGNGNGGNTNNGGGNSYNIPGLVGAWDPAVANPGNAGTGYPGNSGGRYPSNPGVGNPSNVGVRYPGNAGAGTPGNAGGAGGAGNQGAPGGLGGLLSGGLGDNPAAIPALVGVGVELALGAAEGAPGTDREAIDAARRVLSPIADMASAATAAADRRTASDNGGFVAQAIGAAANGILQAASSAPGTDSRALQTAGNYIQGFLGLFGRKKRQAEVPSSGSANNGNANAGEQDAIRSLILTGINVGLQIAESLGTHPRAIENTRADIASRVMPSLDQVINSGPNNPITTLFRGLHTVGTNQPASSTSNNNNSPFGGINRLPPQSQQAVSGLFGLLSGLLG